jgi:putative transcriptional regulator
MSRRSNWALALAFLWQAAGSGVLAAEDLGAGKLLVAARGMPDPSFAETVILLISYDGDGAAGLILNRKTDVRVSRALRELKEAEGVSNPVFIGGPVELQSVLALLRSPSTPEDARNIVGDVYLIRSQKLLQETLKSKADSGRFRVYLGYAGWGPGQLEREMRAGGWHVLKEPANTVFDADPGTLWMRLISKTESQIAMLRPAPEPRGRIWLHSALGDQHGARGIVQYALRD